MNSSLLSRRFPAIYKDIAGIYPRSSDWLFNQLQSTSREGIRLDVSDFDAHVGDAITKLFAEALRRPTYETREDIYQQILELLDKKSESEAQQGAASDGGSDGWQNAEHDANTDAVTFGQLLDALLTNKTLQCSVAADGAPSLTDDALNGVLKSLQDAVVQAADADSNEMFVRHKGAVTAPDHELVERIKRVIRARTGERTQFVHKTHTGRVSVKHPDALIRAMMGASSAYKKRRDDGRLDVAIGLLVDSSGSMDNMLSDAKRVAASIYAALDGVCELVCATFSDTFLFAEDGVPDVNASGGTCGFTAAYQFQELVRRKKGRRKFILLLSDFYFGDAVRTMPDDIPIFGMTYGEEVGRDIRRFRYSGEVTDDNIVEFFLKAVGWG